MRLCTACRRGRGSNRPETASILSSDSLNILTWTRFGYASAVAAGATSLPRDNPNPLPGVLPRRCEPSARAHVPKCRSADCGLVRFDRGVELRIGRVRRFWGHPPAAHTHTDRCRIAAACFRGRSVCPGPRGPVSYGTIFVAPVVQASPQPIGHASPTTDEQGSASRPQQAADRETAAALTVDAHAAGLPATPEPKPIASRGTAPNAPSDTGIRLNRRPPCLKPI
jgi:hypothetical protein